MNVKQYLRKKFIDEECDFSDLPYELDFENWPNVADEDGDEEPLDTENFEWLYVSDDNAIICAGGDWQEPLTLILAMVDDKLTVVDTNTGYDPDGLSEGLFRLMLLTKEGLEERKSDFNNLADKAWNFDLNQGDIDKLNAYNKQVKDFNNSPKLGINGSPSAPGLCNAKPPMDISLSESTAVSASRPKLEAVPNPIFHDWISPIEAEREWQIKKLKKIFPNWPNVCPNWQTMNELIHCAEAYDKASEEEWTTISEDLPDSDVPQLLVWFNNSFHEAFYRYDSQEFRMDGPHGSYDVTGLVLYWKLVKAPNKV